MLDRFQAADSSCRQAVAEILQAVKNRKDEAVLTYGRKFDAPNLAAAQIAGEQQGIARSIYLVDEDFLETLGKAIERIQTFHEREMEDSWLQTREDGTIVGRLVRPVDSAGLYVPGGKGGSTPLVSSVLMNGIPAGIAGVGQRVMVTPPAEDGSVSPHLLVAAQEIGITEIYKAGSAWAIACSGLWYRDHSPGRCDCRTRQSICHRSEKTGLRHGANRYDRRTIRGADRRR